MKTSCLLILTLFLANILDLYSLRFRFFVGVYRGSSIGYSNIISYKARLLYVISGMLFALRFEKYGAATLPYQEMLIVSILSLAYCLIYEKYPILDRALTWAIGPIGSKFVVAKVALSPSEFYHDAVVNWILAIGSAFVYFLISASAAIPVIVAVYFPSHQISAVYIGNIINFFATSISLTVIEPLSMKMADEKNCGESLTSFYVGRRISYVFSCIVWLFAFCFGKSLSLY